MYIADRIGLDYLIKGLSAIWVYLFYCDNFLSQSGYMI
jgi:hypothetical protein